MTHPFLVYVFVSHQGGREVSLDSRTFELDLTRNLSNQLGDRIRDWMLSDAGAFLTARVLERMLDEFTEVVATQLRELGVLLTTPEDLRTSVWVQAQERVLEVLMEVQAARAMPGLTPERLADIEHNAAKLAGLLDLDT